MGWLVARGQLQLWALSSATYRTVINKVCPEQCRWLVECWHVQQILEGRDTLSGVPPILSPSSSSSQPAWKHFFSFFFFLFSVSFSSQERLQCIKSSVKHFVSLACFQQCHGFHWCSIIRSCILNWQRMGFGCLCWCFAAMRFPHVTESHWLLQFARVALFA